MCMSPHEMTSAAIEERLEGFRKILNGQGLTRPLNYFERNTFEGRIEQFEKLLKERADNGTYHTAGTYRAIGVV